MGIAKAPEITDIDVGGVTSPAQIAIAAYEYALRDREHNELRQVNVRIALPRATDDLLGIIVAEVTVHVEAEVARRSSKDVVLHEVVAQQLDDGRYAVVVCLYT